MLSKLEKLEKEISKLSNHEKGILIRTIIQNLDKDRPANHIEDEREFYDELIRRYSEYKSGKAEAKDAYTNSL